MAQEPGNLKENNNTAEINIVPRRLFFGLYMSFFTGSVLSFSLIITAVIIFIGNLLYGKPPADRISFYINKITSLQFHFSELNNARGSEDEAMLAAAAAVGMIIFSILWLSFVLAMFISKRTFARKETVRPILPVEQGQSILCDEGLYRQLYYNRLTKGRLYGLYSWEGLSLYECRVYTVVLKAGHKRIELTAQPGFPGQKSPYDELKALILSHLSEEHKQPPVKKTYYRWGKAAITAGVILILVYILGLWFEFISSQGKGNSNCDIGGGLHEYKYGIATYSFITERYIQPYYVADYDGNIAHVYCRLHGNIYSALHPVTTVWSIYISVKNKLNSGSGWNLFFNMAFYPLLVWSNLIFFIFYNGRVKIYKNLRL